MHQSQLVSPILSYSSVVFLFCWGFLFVFFWGGSLARSLYLSMFSFSFIFTLWTSEMAKCTNHNWYHNTFIIHCFSFSFFSFFGLRQGPCICKSLRFLSFSLCGPFEMVQDVNFFSFDLYLLTKSSGWDSVISLLLKLSKTFIHLIVLEAFLFMLIPFSCMVKF